MSENATGRFSADLEGSLILPEDERYEKARRVYNGMHDRRPAVIVQAANVADVVATVNYARDQDQLLAIRGGGHSVPGFGTCDGGVCLDLSGLNRVHVDARGMTVLAGGGCTLGELDQATHTCGLAVPAGTVSTTGLAGLTLGGGMGHLSRAKGLSIDNLLAAEVVTAAGEVLVCDTGHHPELFWALRGGGGNFGVVTRFKFRAHALPTVYGGPTVFEPDAGVLRNYESLMRDAPEGLNAIFATALALPAPFVPEERHLEPAMVVLACWSGEAGRDEEMADTLAGLGTVMGQGMWRMPFPEMNQFFDELLPPGLRHYWKAAAFRAFDDDCIAAHVVHGGRVPCLESGMFIMPINGACHRVSEEETAYTNRQAFFSAVIAGTWHDADEDAANIRWVRDYHAAVEPYSEQGAYVNFMGETESASARLIYGPKWERLRAVKQAYDPGNLFRLNQNIAP